MQEQKYFYFCSEENELQWMWGLKLSLVCLHMEIQNPKMLNVIQLQMSFMCMFSIWYSSSNSISLSQWHNRWITPNYNWNCIQTGDGCLLVFPVKPIFNTHSLHHRKYLWNLNTPNTFGSGKDEKNPELGRDSLSSTAQFDTQGCQWRSSWRSHPSCSSAWEAPLLPN